MQPTAQSKYNPNELVTITNSKTKQIKQIKRAELADYDLPEDYISQADTYAKAVMAGVTTPDQIPEAYRAGALQSLSGVGYTPASAAERKAKEEQVKKQATKQAQAAPAEKDLSLFEKNFKEAGLRGKLLGGLPAATGLSPESADFESSRKTLAYTLAGVIADQTGRGLSDKDVENFADLLPKRTDTDKEFENKMTNVKTMISYRMDDKKQKEKPKDNKKNGASFSGFLKNASKDAKNTANAILNIPANEIAKRKAVLESKNLPELMENLKKASLETLVQDMAKGTVQSVNETLGRPLEGGDIVGRIGKHAYEKPVETALNVLPVVGTAAKAAKGAVVSKAASGANAASLPKITRGASMGQKLTTGAENAAELVTGGGPKDLISKNVMMDDARSLSKTLLDKKILGQGTTKGRIESTRKALVDEGRNIEKTLKDSPVQYNSSDVADEVGAHLTGLYGEGQAPVVQEIVNQLAKDGSFDITTGSQTITPISLNKAKTGLYDYGLRQLGIGESGKIYNQMAKDAASYLREKLSKDVPEATPHLREYGNLRSYFDDVLNDPTGLNVKGGIWSTVAGMIRQPLEVGIQKAYNMGQGMLPKIAPSANPAPVSVPSGQVAPTASSYLPPISRPVDDAVIDQILKGKGEAQSRRLVKDSKGNWRPDTTVERKAKEKLIERSKKKRYK